FAGQRETSHRAPRTLWVGRSRRGDLAGWGLLDGGRNPGRTVEGARAWRRVTGSPTELERVVAAADAGRYACGIRALRLRRGVLSSPSPRGSRSELKRRLRAGLDRLVADQAFV